MIGEVETFCESEGTIESQINFAILARAYEGHDGSPVTLPYFVAVLKDNSQLITKRTYEVTLNFDQNGLARMPQSVIAEVGSIDQARSYTYEVLVGFQIEPSDVYYNLVR